MTKSKNKSFFGNAWVVGTGTAVLGVFLLRVIDGVADTKILASIWQGIIVFFGKEYNVQLWGLILISFSGLLLLVIIAWVSSFFSKGVTIATEPSFITYRSDVFGSVLYKWEYEKGYDGKYLISNFEAYCPNDNCLLHHGRCPICHTMYGMMKGFDELQILIRHRIDNNLYPKSSLNEEK